MKRKHWLIVAILLLYIPLARGQDEQFKALFMYNFTKYLEWPAEKEKGDFIITVYGNSPIINELKVIAQKKNVGNQKIVVKKITTLSECASCNILFIPKSKSLSSTEVQKVSNKGIVIITDKDGAAKQYSGINYVKVDGRQSFEINETHIKAQGVKINSQLITLGIKVD
ncbi:MAG: YfiR family protein [Bacteroidales bacterium]|nr:YfiR family protein [Bacteroidales bacterium]